MPFGVVITHESLHDPGVVHVALNVSNVGWHPLSLIDGRL